MRRNTDRAMLTDRKYPLPPPIFGATYPGHAMWGPGKPGCSQAPQRIKTNTNKDTKTKTNTKTKTKMIKEISIFGATYPWNGMCDWPEADLRLHPLGAACSQTPLGRVGHPRKKC